MSRPRVAGSRLRYQVTLDLPTVKLINRIIKDVHEIETPSAAIRYLARCYQSEAAAKAKRGDDVTP